MPTLTWDPVLRRFICHGTKRPIPQAEQTTRGWMVDRKHATHLQQAVNEGEITPSLAAELLLAHYCKPVTA